jgi:hydroxymethylglutaryl-CoA lyase
MTAAGLVYVISASDAHNVNNVRKPIAASLEELARLIRQLRPAGRFRFNLATAFDCPFEGTTPLGRTLTLVGEVLVLAPGGGDLPVRHHRQGRAAPGE